MGTRFYVAGTLGSCYPAVLDHLRRAGFEDSHQIWLRETRLERGVRTVRKLLYFPGYVFIRFDTARDPWQRINRCVGVNRLLPVGAEEPRPLPEGFVEGLLEASSGGLLDRERAECVVHKYVRDEDVRVRCGGFEGQVGKFAYYRKGSLVLLLSLLGRECQLTFRPHEVEPMRAVA